MGLLYLIFLAFFVLCTHIWYTKNYDKNKLLLLLKNKIKKGD